mmetsp:Transcript_18675/g.28228  ORF Transcript_18675/g.28228 Transcript_18675/m.28228 type:complete len:89 (+) Transcript_18675:237-503(+)
MPAETMSMLQQHEDRNIRAVHSVIMAVLQQHEDEAFQTMLAHLDSGINQEVPLQLRSKNLSQLRTENIKIFAHSVPNFTDEQLNEMLE